MPNMHVHPLRGSIFIFIPLRCCALARDPHMAAYQPAASKGRLELQVSFSDHFTLLAKTSK